jgi:hypothetical protein
LVLPAADQQPFIGNSTSGGDAGRSRAEDHVDPSQRLRLDGLVNRTILKSLKSGGVISDCSYRRRASAR